MHKGTDEHSTYRGFLQWLMMVTGVAVAVAGNEQGEPEQSIWLLVIVLHFRAY